MFNHFHQKYLRFINRHFFTINQYFWAKFSILMFLLKLHSVNFTKIPVLKALETGNATGILMKKIL